MGNRMKSLKYTSDVDKKYNMLNIFTMEHILDVVSFSSLFHTSVNQVWFNLENSLTVWMLTWIKNIYIYIPSRICFLFQDNQTVSVFSSKKSIAALCCFWQVFHPWCCSNAFSLALECSCHICLKFPVPCLLHVNSDSISSLNNTVKKFLNSTVCAV